MKTLHIFRSLLACSMLAIALFSSCKKHGSDPEPDRNKFLGTYLISESCSGFSDDYEISISAGTEDNEIEINGLYYPELKIKAIVSGNKLTIPQQDASVSLGDDSIKLTVNGSGSFNDSRLNINYKITYDDSDSEVCTTIANKQAEK